MTLKRRLFIVTLAVNVFIITCIYVMVRYSVLNTVNDLENKNARKLLDMAMLSIKNEYNSLQYHRNYSFEHRKSDTKDIIEIAITSIQSTYEDYLSGKITLQEAKDHALKNTMDIRFHDGNGYIWINNTEKPIPRLIGHPHYPEFNNKITDHPVFYTSADSTNIPKLAMDLCEVQGSGFIQYSWTKPSNPKYRNELPKTSYVKIFETWDWVLGAGVYLEDIEFETQKRLSAILDELKQTIGKMHMAETGYFFIFNSKKELLLHPAISSTGLDSAYYNDSFSPLTEIMEAAKTTHKTYEYLWNSPLQEKRDFEFTKKVFVEYFEPLDWYVCASIYKNEIQHPAIVLGRRILLISIVFFVLTFVVAIKLSDYFTKPIRNLMYFVNKVPKNRYDIDAWEIPIKGSVEIMALETAVKDMLLSIEEQNEHLLKAKQETEKSELELRKSEERYRFMVEHAPSVFWMFDVEGKTRYISPNVMHFVGFSADEFYKFGANIWMERIHHEDKPKVLKAYKALFEKNEHYDATYRIKSKDNTWVWVHAIGDKNVEIFGQDVVYGIATDISLKKHSEQQVLKAVIHSEESERSRIAKDLHDGVSPLLSAIKLFTQSMRDTENEKIKNELATKIGTTIDEAIQSVHEISANISPHILVNFGLIKAVEAFLSKILPHKKINYNVDSTVEKRLPREIEIALYRVCTELINNTIKYAKASEIYIQIISECTCVKMEYSDNGIGFDIERVVDTKHGMGIFNIKNRVDSLNGQIDIESIPNSGTTVKIAIPLQDEQ